MNSVSQTQPRSVTDPRSVALIAAMAMGSIVMWVLIPLGWVLLAAHFSKTGQPTLAPLLMIFFGMPLSMIPAGKVLGMLDRRHMELRGYEHGRKPAPWRRSMRDSTDDGPQSMLAVVMVISVALAFVALGIWFFFFAGSSLPS